MPSDDDGPYEEFTYKVTPSRVETVNKSGTWEVKYNYVGTKRVMEILGLLQNLGFHEIDMSTSYKGSIDLKARRRLKPYMDKTKELKEIIDYIGYTDYTIDELKEFAKQIIDAETKEEIDGLMLTIKK